MGTLNSKIIVRKENLLNNIRVIKKRLNDGVKTMAVIKDNAYGHGFEGVAHCLNPEVDWFCVARVREGIQLREAGITKPILVFELPLWHTAELYPKYELTATVGSLDSFDMLQPGTEFHINLDTGMRRLGISPDEVEELVTKLRSNANTNLTGIYTHFAKADDPGNPEVKAQLELFNILRAKFGNNLFTHTANTGAIFHYSDLDLQFDAVRPGVSLFGYGAGDLEIKALKPAMEWQSFLMQVKAVKKGDPVSYGGRWLAPENGFIGIVPVGYSSGILRPLSGLIEFEINGIKYPQVGTISMDYSIVYLGQNPPKPDSRLILLNTGELNARVWADKAKTIPYEITTGLHPLIQREFVD